ncbi:MAG: B12-binding domain-containing radical SAM protein [Burkholderiales bacterium]|nr:B12-binding domain-containing radical SAM protein [Bacteroidia bacterium]
MKILFTHGYFLSEDPKELQIMRPYVPLGILYISAFLEKNGFENEVFDSTFSTLDKLKEKILDTKPDAIAIYTNLMTKLNVLKIIKFIRSESTLQNTKIILGGPEVRNYAENFLNYGADFIIIGEGEETTLELITALNSSTPLRVTLHSIKGLAYLENGKVITTPERVLIKDINTLPFPNRKKIDFVPYLNGWKTHHGYSMMSVNTMRGCPYTCKWCSRAVYGGTYRRRSPQLVAQEMKHIKDTYNPDMIWFVDDVFTIHHKWLTEFAEEVKKQDAVIPYEIISRADRLNEEVIKTLKASGCFRVWVGAESGSQKIIDAMDRRVDVMQTRHMINLAKQHGLEAGTFIMLGYPGETKEDIKETIEHLVQSNPSQYTITIAYPIKGTELYNEVKNEFLDQRLEWETSTDRDIDFKRTHPKQYYQYAIQWVMNEVYLKTKNKNLLKVPYLKLKSLKYQLQMELNK